MRYLFLSLLLLTACVMAVPARDASDERRTPRRVNEFDRRARLQGYLAAFRRLSPVAQARVRQLDFDLREEDAETRARLVGVMERYALWLSHLSEMDRTQIEEAPAGPDRLRLVREIIDRQWLDNLPPARKEMLAKSTDAERPSLIARWHKEEQDRQQDRVWAMRSVQERMLPGQEVRRKQFLDDVDKFVKTKLEPKLNSKQKDRLHALASRGTGTYLYLHQVWVMSQNHNLTPPGPPDTWAMFREPRR
jgi:hypothetical protein